MRRPFWIGGLFGFRPSLNAVAKINFPFCTVSSTSYQELLPGKEIGLSVNFTTNFTLESKLRMSG